MWSAGSTPADAGRRVALVVGAVAGLAVVGSALATLGSAGWIQDDLILFARHAHPGELRGEWTQSTFAAAGHDAGWMWMPLPASVQHLVGGLFGREPATFRALGLGVHLLTCALVGRLARALGASPWAAAVAALAVLVHPVTPGVTCWPSDLCDGLGAAMLLLAALAAVGSSAVGAIPGAGLALLAAAFCKPPMLAAIPVVATFGAWRGGLRRGAGIALAGGLAAALHVPLYLDVATVGVPVDQVAGGSFDPLHRAVALLGLASWAFVTPAWAMHGHLFDPGDLAPLLPGLAVALALLGAAAAAWRRGGAVALAAAATWVWLLLPAALIAVPRVGLQPFRYAYAPLALAAPVLALAATRAAATRLGPYLGWLAAAWFLASAPRTATRVASWVDEAHLWSAELAVEPGRPYLVVQWARAFGPTPPPEALRAWRDAIEALPPTQHLARPADERLELAKAAFRSGDWALALEQAERLRAGTQHQAEAACIAADALDRLGRPAEAEAVARGCR